MGNTISISFYNCNCFSKTDTGYFKKIWKIFYSLSFNEGVNTNIIEVISKNKSIFAEQSQNLSSFIFSKNDSQYIYRLSFNNKDELTKFKDKISKEKNIEKINMIYE